VSRIRVPISKTTEAQRQHAEHVGKSFVVFCLCVWRRLEKNLPIDPSAKRKRCGCGHPLL
jgi:hypothetical protein